VTNPFEASRPAGFRMVSTDAVEPPGLGEKTSQIVLEASYEPPIQRSTRKLFN
jgi:hypothetical protein